MTTADGDGTHHGVAVPTNVPEADARRALEKLEHAADILRTALNGGVPTTTIRVQLTPALEEAEVLEQIEALLDDNHAEYTWEGP